MTRRVTYFAGGAAFLLLAAWFLLLWSPKGSELSDARDRNAAAEQKMSELQLKLDRLKALERRSPELQASRDRLVSAVPDKAELAQFILDTNDAAAKAGVDFLSINPNTPAISAIPGAPSAVHVQLTVSGDYFATLNFLDRLTELPRLVLIDQVQLLPAGEEAGGKLSANLSGDIFTTQPPAAVAGLPSPAATATTTTTVQP